MKKIKFVAIFLFIMGSLVAQNIDLSKLSPEQVAAYKKMKGGTSATTNTTQDEVTERSISDNSEQNGSASKEFAAKKNNNNEQNKPVKPSDIFGSYLFSKQNLTFEPNLNIPTPPNYILGTYDELIVDISGMYEANYKPKVTPEGYIRIANVSPIKVS